MTSGERMVWAAEYVRARGAGHSIALSVYSASRAVDGLHAAAAGAKPSETEPKFPDMSSPEVRERLEDMLSTGADR